MLPPFNSGLHCGQDAKDALNIPQAGAPAVQQRAPLRLGVEHGPDPGVESVPAGQRRAPLRQHRRGDAPVRDDPVLPPINGGLHCGVWVAYRSSSIRRVLPPFTGGLHCGGMPRIDRAMATMTVFPPFTGGLHCGDGTTDGRFITRQMLPPINGGLH